MGECSCVSDCAFVVNHCCNRRTGYVVATIYLVYVLVTAVSRARCKTATQVSKRTSMLKALDDAVKSLNSKLVFCPPIC